MSGDGERVSSFRRTILLELKSSVTLRSAVLRFIFSLIMRILKPCTTLRQNKTAACKKVKWRCWKTELLRSRCRYHTVQQIGRAIEHNTNLWLYLEKKLSKWELHTHTRWQSFAMASHRQQIYTFHRTRKYGKSVALLFCLTLGTLYTSSRPLSSTDSLVFSLPTQGSRQNHMETTSPFFYCLRENPSFLRMRSIAPPIDPVAVGTVKFKNYWSFPHTLEKPGYAKKQLISKTTVARSLFRYAGKFYVLCEFS